MAPAQGNFSLTAECSALIRSLKKADKNWFAMCSDFRDAGQHWLNIKAECRVQGISAATWAADNAPLSKRWLDKYAEFASRWDEFEAASEWSQSLIYAPDRRPGLWGCFDLMDAKLRFATYSEARRSSYRGGNKTESQTEMPYRLRNGNTVPIRASQQEQAVDENPIRLNQTAELLHGDVTEMTRRHLTDASIDVAIVDPPYFLRGPQDEADVELPGQQSGKKPMFNEAWDRFPSIEDYETFCTGWIGEAIRCLDEEGSLFIFGTYHNLGLINRICQIKGYVIVNEIIWVRRNSRPNVATRRLQASHQNILWIVKDREKYRFNYRLCKRTLYDDWLSKRNQPARDVWDILTNGRENKSGHPSPKPLAIYERMLDVAGKPGGLLLDLFSGSGTGAVAAAGWGMRSVSIEREDAYVQMIRERVAAEVQGEVE